MESVVHPDPVLAARVNATAVEGQSAADVAPPMLGECSFFSLSRFFFRRKSPEMFFRERLRHSKESKKKHTLFLFPQKNKTGVGAASDHVIIGGKLPVPMPGEEAAAASAAVSDLPGAGGAGVLSGTGKPADAAAANETLALVSGAGVSASGDGDGGSNGSERQQLAGGGGDGSSNASSDQSVISYASGERKKKYLLQIFLFFRLGKEK